MPCPKESHFKGSPDIVPLKLAAGMPVSDFIEAVGRTCFEARNVWRGAELYRRMVEDGCVNWLGISGAGIAGGLGGVVTSLIEAGFVDVICTTGAQAYHDLHFAFGLPVKAISPQADDDLLRRTGDTRIYDIGIRERETLEAQDEIIRRFIEERYDRLRDRDLSSPDFMLELGLWAGETSRHPERSFVVAAARAGVPVFWDSSTNHSIALNIARMAIEGKPLRFPLETDIIVSAAIAYGSEETGFVELGGGGPKNFIQQTGPTIEQIMGIGDYDGASRGLQITTANVREGSLSSCTFGEAVTWGKYESADEMKLVQIWGEYSFIFPAIAAYVLDRAKPREHKRVFERLGELSRKLLDRQKEVASQ